MRRLFCLFLAVMLCCAPIAQAVEAIFPSEVVITKIVDPPSLLGSEVLFFDYQEGVCPQGLPQTVRCLTDGVDGDGGALYYDCPIVWDCSDIPAEGGMLALTGALQPEEGYLLPKELSTPLYYPMLVVAPGMDPIELSGADTEPRTFLLPQGGDISTLALDTLMGTYYTPQGWFFRLPLTCDVSGVDTQKPGAYPLWGIPDIPSYFIVPDPSPYLPPIDKLPIWLGVVEPDRVDLSAAFQQPYVASLSSYWSYRLRRSAGVQNRGRPMGRPGAGHGGRGVPLLGVR